MNLTSNDLNALADLVAARISARLSMVTVARWLTLDEACAYMRVKKTCLMKLIRRGDVHAAKTSPGRGGWRVDRTSIDDRLNEGRIR